MSKEPNLIEVYTCGSTGFDTLDEAMYRGEETMTVNHCRLPRGYREEHDETGKRYILCPNGAKIYELDQHSRDAKYFSFTYRVDERFRTIRMPIMRHKRIRICNNCGTESASNCLRPCPQCGKLNFTLKTLPDWEPL